MKIAAVVCEYHPFHNGHAYQLKTAREQLGCDGVVGIMSGNFVQRGEPALFPKQQRAKAALLNGMDLVLELPAVQTLQSAERYANNAVATLHALGCVDTLFFGAECPDTDVLMQIAMVLAREDTAFSQAIKGYLEEGVSFAVARSRAVEEILGPASAEILSQPNNILAVEYCKALIRNHSNIKPHAILRKGVGHHDADGNGEFASGSAIREKIQKGEEFLQYLPTATHPIYESGQTFRTEEFERAVLASLCMKTPEELEKIADVSEGLEYAVLRSAFEHQTLEETAQGVKSKRYAFSRIRRILLNAYLGITKEDSRMQPAYIRILDFNETGQKILHHAKTTATLPLAKNGAQVKEHPRALALWKRELAIDKVYRLYLR
ncbi:MAG: nucleotidyltransferase family protein [Clostridia bacterium]|nr:nucleotidyltransferase family protein [Clostridia bacterium]